MPTCDQRERKPTAGAFYVDMLAGSLTRVYFAPFEYLSSSEHLFYVYFGHIGLIVITL